MMPDLTIEQIKTMRAAITQGKWHAVGNEIYQRDHSRNRKPIRIITRPDHDGLEDAEFIALSPEIVDVLLAEIERRDKRLSDLKDRIADGTVP